jgi:hypothetical protein
MEVKVVRVQARMACGVVRHSGEYMSVCATAVLVTAFQVVLWPR